MGRLAALTRFIQRLLGLLAMLLLLVAVAGATALYLAATGASLPLLRGLTSGLGQLIAGQHTERMVLDVHVMPDSGRLSGSATLTVRSPDAARQRFYVLLNPGLRVRRLRVGGRDPSAPPPSAYQLALLTVVDLGQPLPKGASAELTLDYEGTIMRGTFGDAASVVNPRHVMLAADGFWYPADVQGCFAAEVAITLPADMTLVHNGIGARRVQRGNVQQVRWTSERPVAGVSLAAGAYRLTSARSDDTSYRLYLPDDVDLDTDRLLTSMATANRALSERYGPSGFTQLTLFVTRELRRAYNDGSGLMGLSMRYLRAGDYGFATIAHEIAHNWWGATVGEQWLAPGPGGEWIVEGLAEFSSLLATEAAYGPDALTRRLTGAFFDPARQAALSSMSVLDNALNEATARDTIYRKGAYVAFMLRQVLGDEAYFAGLREFITRFRYRHATDHDLQEVLQETSGKDLDAFFADWVRSDRLADLSLDADGQGTLTVSNLGNAVVPGEIDLWTFPTGGGRPRRSTTRIGDTFSLPEDAESVVLDPLLAWADVQRENNRYPRRNDPFAVRASVRGDVAIATGQPFPWGRAALSRVSPEGKTLHTWDFERGLAGPPNWSLDGERLVVSHADATEPFPAVVGLDADGTRTVAGRGNSPVIGADGAIIVARQDRLMRLGANGKDITVVRRPGWQLEHPQTSPDGRRVAYIAGRGNRLEIRTAGIDGDDDRFLLSWDRDSFVHRWAPDGTSLYAIAGGTWDWQVWQIPLDGGSVSVLASGAAAISDLSVSPDGAHIAFSAVPHLDYPTNRRQLYVLNLRDRDVRTIDVPGSTLGRLSWTQHDRLLVVATRLPEGSPWFFPSPRHLKQVNLSDGSIEDVQLVR